MVTRNTCFAMNAVDHHQEHHHPGHICGDFGEAKSNRKKSRNQPVDDCIGILLKPLPPLPWNAPCMRDFTPGLQLLNVRAHRVARRLEKLLNLCANYLG